MKEKAFPGILKYQRIGEAEEAKGSEGMDLRDYFAAKAMQAIIIGSVGKVDPNIELESHIKDIPNGAYYMADLMLKERDK